MVDFKRCPRCSAVKPSAEFQRNRTSRDGLHTYCRPCHSEVSRVYRLNNPEREKERRRRSRKRNAELIRQSQTAWRHDNPEKRRAHNAVWWAVNKSGALVRPDSCERCGTNERIIQAHHEDYARPLDVRWLCSLCHAHEHVDLTPATGTAS